MDAPGRDSKNVSDEQITAWVRFAYSVAPPLPLERGYLDDKPGGMTRDEIGAEFGVTRERIRQIEIQALAKCRRWCERNGYRLEDLLG